VACIEHQVKLATSVAEHILVQLDGRGEGTN